MSKWFFVIFIFVSLVNCKRNRHQVVELKNLSSQTVYYLISKNRTITNANEIADIRPKSYESFIESEKNQIHVLDEEDSLMRLKQNLFQYRIEANASTVVMSSESAEIYVDKISIQSIIKDRYNGEANIFLIKSRDLEENSDVEIIERKLYIHLISLTEEDITRDTVVIEYR
jgi:hypothetical protein